MEAFDQSLHQRKASHGISNIVDLGLSTSNIQPRPKYDQSTVNLKL